LVFDFEVVAPSRFSICLARSIEDIYNIWIDERPIDHVLVGTERNSLEVHHSIAHKNGFEIDLGALSDKVVCIDQHCQVGNVLACVGLSCDEENILPVFGKLGEEVDDSVETVIGC
jgi:hypothetical protein